MASIPKSAEKASRKSFIPLESNPDVFTELVHKLGLSESLCFQDVLSLDDLELLAFIPRPAYALVLVFPTTEGYNKRMADEDAKADVYDGYGEGEPVVYFKQTIYNACGLYALLHAISNGEAKMHIGKFSREPLTHNAATSPPWFLPAYNGRSADVLHSTGGTDHEKKKSPSWLDSSTLQWPSNQMNGHWLLKATSNSNPPMRP
jgi:hypothetical protein